MCLARDVGGNGRQKKQRGVHEVEVAEDGARRDAVGEPERAARLPADDNCAGVAPALPRAASSLRRCPHASTSLLPSYRCRISTPPAAKTVCRMNSWRATNKIASAVRDPSAGASRGDEGLQRCCARWFRLGARARAIASRGDGTSVCKPS